MTSIYLIGSLRNPEVPTLQNLLRGFGHDVFASWHAAGPEADDHWQAFEKGRGLTFEQALRDHAAQHVYNFDRRNLDRCDAAVLVMPAGKSAHLELGYWIGRAMATGKPNKSFILLPKEPDRWDVMYAFAARVCTSAEELLKPLGL